MCQKKRTRLSRVPTNNHLGRPAPSEKPSRNREKTFTSYEKNLYDLAFTSSFRATGLRACLELIKTGVCRCQFASRCSFYELNSRRFGLPTLIENKKIKKQKTKRRGPNEFPYEKIRDERYRRSAPQIVNCSVCQFFFAGCACFSAR